MNKFQFFFLLLIVNSGITVAQNGLFINEFMASNSKSIEDPDFGKTQDWIEIYNNGLSVVNLNGFYLTDDLQKPTKWKIKFDVFLQPNDFIMFWADNKDTLWNHTDFNLSKEGEQIGLFSPDGTPIDTITYSTQYEDISYGRNPDAGASWYFFDKPTPAASNNTSVFSEILPEPEFSLPGGFYPGGIYLSITCPDTSAAIRYTTNGAVPDSFSSEYISPIVINSTTVIRTASFKQGCKSSRVITTTYFINEIINLPVVSISTNPENLWDDYTGIYVEGKNGIAGYCSNGALWNWNQDWERPIHFEMYEKDKSFAFGIDAGMKIGGGCTRKYDQKSLAIYARSTYGAGKIKYPVFHDRPHKEYNNLNVRNSGQDWYRTLFRDGLMQSIVKDQMDIDWQAYKPAVVFLNGEYWGIHGIREKHNEHYISQNYNIDPDSIDILTANAEVMNGSAEHYNSLIDFIKSKDLSPAINYEHVKKQMDIDEYINYQIAEIFFANADWPGGNIKYWRPQKPGGKWRWIIFDLDLGFGAHSNGKYDTNTLQFATAENQDYYANPSWSTLLFRKLLTNTEFKNNFIQRFAFHLNTTFHVDRVKHNIDSIKTLVAPEIPRHKQKWVKSMTLGGNNWEELLGILYTFAEKRAGYIRSYTNSKFGISGSAVLNIKNDNNQKGKIYINGILVPGDNFSGIFFKDIPIELKAIPETGYLFTRWEGISDLKNDSINIILSENSEITARFENDNITSVKQENETLDFYISQNYPNPFNSSTKISFKVPETSQISIKVFDILGNEMQSILNEKKPAGIYEFTFPADYRQGVKTCNLPSGVYFYSFKAVNENGKTFSSTRKMVYLK